MEQPPKMPEQQRETTSVEGHVLLIDDLKELAGREPTQEVSLETLKEWVGEGHSYWEDRNGDALGPSQILSDPEQGATHPEWADHVASIKRANFENPIWILDDTGQPIDGMHRLTNAFLTGRKTILVKRMKREDVLRLSKDA